MNTKDDIAFHNAVAANGGIISDEIRQQFNVGKPEAKAGKTKAAKSPVKTEDDNTPVEIPADWEKLPWKSREKLAKEIDTDFEANPEDRVASIDARITAEIQRRADADGGA